MDTRYTMRLAAPLGDEEIPAFAERLADIIKGDPSKLETLLARGTKSLIRATSKEEAERVASVFRRAGLDVEVVSREQAALPPEPAPVAEPASDVPSAPPTEFDPAAEPDAATAITSEPPYESEFDDPPPAAAAARGLDVEIGPGEPRPAYGQRTSPMFDEMTLPGEETPSLADDAPPTERDPAVDPAPLAPDHEAGAEFAAPVDDAADPPFDPFGDEDRDPVATGAAPLDEDAFDDGSLPPADATRFDDRVEEGDPPRERYRAYPPPAPSLLARLAGLGGALLLLLAPFLGSASEGIAVGSSAPAGIPFGWLFVALGLVALLPIVLGRSRWLWIFAVAAAAVWLYALVDTGRANELETVFTAWGWLLPPLGALLLLIASLRRSPRRPGMR